MDIAAFLDRCTYAQAFRAIARAAARKDTATLERLEVRHRRLLDAKRTPGREAALSAIEIDLDLRFDMDFLF